MSRQYLIPRELAKLWRTTPEAIIDLIRSGLLRAFTTSAPGSRRPRWKIPPDAIVEFESRQAARPPTKPVPRRRPVGNVTEYY